MKGLELARAAVAAVAVAVGSDRACSDEPMRLPELPPPTGVVERGNPLDRKPTTERPSQAELTPELLRRAVFDYVHYRREEYRDAAMGRDAPKRPEVLTDRVMAALEEKFRPLDAAMKEQILRGATIEKLASITHELSRGPESLKSAESLIGIAISTAKIQASVSEIQRRVHTGPSKAEIEKAEQSLKKLQDVATSNRERAKELEVTSKGLQKVANLFDSSLPIIDVSNVYDAVFKADDPAKAAIVVKRFEARFSTYGTIYDRVTKQVGEMVEKERPGMEEMAKHMAVLGRVMPIMVNKSEETLATFAQLQRIGAGTYGRGKEPVEGQLTTGVKPR